MRGILKLIGFSLGIFLFIVILTGTVSFIRHTWFGSNPSSSNHVRVMELTGVLYSSLNFLDDLKEYLENRHTKALVVRVNSPGGLVAPSQEIYEALRKADEKIPVIISMDSVAASGGYYVALGGRKIFANPGTMTGSIGVLMEFMNTQKLYQWAKLDRFTITSGKFKDAGSPLKPMSAADKALFQDLIKDIYAQFRGTVKERRKLKEEQLDEVADGRVLTGHQALAAKLVDALGGLKDAVEEAKRLAKMDEDAPVLHSEKPKGFLRKFLLGEDDGGESSLLSGLVSTASSVSAPALSSGPQWRVLWMAPVR